MDIAFGINTEEPKVQIPFASARRVWVNTEKYKYQGEEKRRFVLTGEKGELAKINTEVCPYVMDPQAFLLEDNIWLHYRRDRQRHLLKMKVNGRKIQEEYVFPAESDISMGSLLQVYEIEGIGLLLDFSRELKLFRYKDNELVSFAEKTDADKSVFGEKLLSIYSQKGDFESPSTILLFGDEYNGIYDIAKQGKFLSWEYWVDADIVEYLKRSVRTYLKENDPEMLFDVDCDGKRAPVNPLRYMKIEYHGGKGKYSVTMMANYSGSDVKPWILWISADGQTLQDEWFNEIEVWKYVDSYETEEPAFVQIILDRLYCCMIMNGLRRRELSWVSKKFLREKLFAWYDEIDESGKPVQLIAIENSVISGDDQDYEVVYVGLSENSNLEQDMIKIGSDRSMKKVVEMSCPVKYRSILQTDDILPQMEKVLVPLAEIMNSYEQKRLYEDGNPNYDTFNGVTAQKLTAMIYAIRQYVPGKSLYFWICLGAYGFENRAYIYMDLENQKISIQREKTFVALEKAKLPDLMQYKACFPRSKADCSGKDKDFIMKNNRNYKCKYWKAGMLCIERIIDADEEYREACSFIKKEDVLYDDFSLLCKTSDDKWITHPYLRHIRAYAFLPQRSIVYATKEGMFLLTADGKNTKVSDINEVLEMKYENNELQVYVFESFGSSHEDTHMVMDLYDVTTETTTINYKVLPIPIN